MPTEAPIVSRLHRILRLLVYLDSGPRYNAGQLATEFQVSRRTIYRDIKLLRDQGLRVEFDEDNDGYFLASGCDLPSNTPLDREEVVALSLAAHLGLPTFVPPLASMVREALARMLRNYPDELRQEVSNLLSSSVADIPELETNADSPEVVRDLISAIRTRRHVRLQFRTPQDGLDQTKFAPYVIVITPHGWSVVGRSSVHRKTCSVLLRDVESAEITEETYKIPRGFRERSPFLPDHSKVRATPFAEPLYEGLTGS